MSDIFSLANDLIQSIDTARSIHYTTATTDSTAITQRSDEENETTKAGVFLVDECFSVMNASRERCRAHHRDDIVEDDITTECCYSCDKCGTDRQEDREKIKLDSNRSTMVPYEYSNGNVSVITQQFDDRSSSQQVGNMYNPTILKDDNGKKYSKFKYVQCGDADDGDGRTKIKAKKAKEKHNKIMAVARNRLNREKKKKRAIPQPHAHTPAQQMTQSHKKSSIVESIVSRTDETDTSTDSNDITTATGPDIHNTTTSRQSNNKNNSSTNNIPRSDKIPPSKPGNNTTTTPTNKTTSTAKLEVNGDLVVDVNTIAYECLEAFLQEVKEFQETICHYRRGKEDDANETIMKKHGDSFASFLEEKYVRQSLDKLNTIRVNHHTSPIVKKVRTLITRFIAKCRESSSSSSSSSVVDISKQFCNILKRYGGACSDDRLKKYNGHREKNLSQKRRWTCSICGKVNTVIVGRESCSTCGRRRGYQGSVGLKLEEHQKVADAELSKYRHMRPDRVEEEFLAKSSTNLRLPATKLPVSSSEKNARKFYLHGKDDYEIDSRAELMDNIRNILQSVRSVI